MKHAGLFKPGEPETNVGQAMPDMVGIAHPTESTLALPRHDSL